MMINFKLGISLNINMSELVSELYVKIHTIMISWVTFTFSAKLNGISCAFQNDLDDPERGMIFVCSATHKTKSMFFFLTQTEQGDVFKITLETDEDMVRGESFHVVKHIVVLLRCAKCLFGNADTVMIIVKLGISLNMLWVNLISECLHHG